MKTRTVQGIKSDYESEGRRFNSCRAHQYQSQNRKIPFLFAPSPAPLNIEKLATDCRIGVLEARQTLEQIVQDGNFIIECDRRGGGGTVWLPSGGDLRS